MNAQSKLPGLGFFTTVCIGAFALIAGVAAPILDLRDGEGFHWRFIGIAAFGAGFIVLAFLCEHTGRFRTFAVVLRNTLVALIVVAFILLGLLMWTGAILH
jgi:hypothetical protein